MNAVTMQGDAPTARQDHVRVRRLTRPPGSLRAASGPVQKRVAFLLLGVLACRP